MKKVLFTMLGMGLLSLSAQTVNEQIVNDQKNYKFQKLDIISSQTKTEFSSLKRDIGTGWFDYVKAYADANDPSLKTDANRRVFWMQPDTNLNIVYSDSKIGNINWHVLGRMNDPRDPVYTSNPIRFSRYNTYTWDSIRFSQSYIRNVDSAIVGGNLVEVVDTVFIQYFQPTGIDNKSFYYTATPTVSHYASTPKVNNYKVKTLLNSAAFKTDTIFLTKAYANEVTSTTVGTTSFTLPVGRTIPASATNLNANLTCHMITFKPMLKTVLNDTFLAFDNSPVFNKHNGYGLLYSYKTGLVVDDTDPQAQNNSVITNSQVVYGQTVGNFWKSYIPGTQFQNTFFDNTEYFLTSNNVSVDAVNAKVKGSVNVYPNPSKENSEVFLEFNAENNSNAVINVLDITGKVVKTINAEIVNGDNSISISTVALSKGIYVVNLVGNGFTTSTKLVIE